MTNSRNIIAFVSLFVLLISITWTQDARAQYTEIYKLDKASGGLKDDIVFSNIGASGLFGQRPRSVGRDRRAEFQSSQIRRIPPVAVRNAR
jgi:hypothetical protein